MKKKIIPIITILTSSLLLSSCGLFNRSKYTKNLLDYLFETNTNGDWKHLGEKVDIDSPLTVHGSYGKTIIAGCPKGETNLDLSAIEINCKSMPKWKESSIYGGGYGARISAKGTIGEQNGRLILEDATIHIVDERKYVSSTEYTGGGTIHYCSGEDTKRVLWDTKLNRAHSGALFQIYAQVASLPEFISGESSSFKIVFPGEDVNEERSLINVQIPNEMDSYFLNNLHVGFEKCQIGTFLNIIAPLQYDVLDNNGMGFVLDQYASINIDYLEERKIPTIYSSWSDLQYDYRNIVDLSSWRNAYSFTIENVLDGVPNELQEYFDGNYSKYKFVDIAAHISPNNSQKALEELYDYICQHYCATGRIGENIVYGQDENRQTLLMATNYGPYIEIYYIS